MENYECYIRSQRRFTFALKSRETSSLEDVMEQQALSDSTSRLVRARKNRALRILIFTNFNTFSQKNEMTARQTWKNMNMNNETLKLNRLTLELIILRLNEHEF